MISGKSIFAIFAIAMVAMFAGSLSSCNSDEEYKECLDTNTLAKGMMTRSGVENTASYRKTKTFDKSTWRFVEYNYNGISYSAMVLFNLEIYRVTNVNDPSDSHLEAVIECDDDNLYLSCSEIRNNSAKISVNIKNPEFNINELDQPEYILISGFYIDEYTE